MILETLALSIFNHDCAIASAASRMVDGGARPAAGRDGLAPHARARGGRERPGGLHRRLHDDLEPARRVSSTAIPTSGTSAHAFTLLHDDEREAFAAQLDALGPGTTLLVDTYDVPAAIRAAVELAGPELGAIRIDSGDLATVAREARGAA